MSWQHWILVIAYAFSILAAINNRGESNRGDLGVLGGIIGIMLLIWGQR